MNRKEEIQQELAECISMRLMYAITLFLVSKIYEDVRLLRSTVSGNLSNYIIYVELA